MEVAQPIVRGLPRDIKALDQVILIIQSINEALWHQELCGKLVRLRLCQAEGRGTISALRPGERDIRGRFLWAKVSLS